MIVMFLYAIAESAKTSKGTVLSARDKVIVMFLYAIAESAKINKGTVLAV